MRTLYATLFLIFTMVTANALPDMNLLAKLSNAHAVSSNETEVRNILKDHWSKTSQTIEIDGFGNLIAYKPSKTKNAPTVLVMAHMDEIGLQVRSISDDGYVYFNKLGGIFDTSLMTQSWQIKTPKGNVLAYSGVDSKHSSDDIDATKVTDFKFIFLDVGASDKQDAETRLGLRPGLTIAPNTTFHQLNGSDKIIGKAFDDRLGLYVQTQLLEWLKNELLAVNVVFAATVQEEIGLRGASILYNRIKPDIVLNLESGIAKDFPLLKTKWPEHTPILGKGPTLFVSDRTVLPNNNLLDFILAHAKSSKIPFQYESGYHYGEDAARLQQEGDSVPAINIGIPVRYAHTHSGVADLNDIENTTMLIEETLKNLSGKKVTAIKTFA